MFRAGSFAARSTGPAKQLCRVFRIQKSCQFEVVVLILLLIPFRQGC